MSNVSVHDVPSAHVIAIESVPVAPVIMKSGIMIVSVPVHMEGVAVCEKKVTVRLRWSMPQDRSFIGAKLSLPLRDVTPETTAAGHAPAGF